jgi:hypothetical protein
MCNKYNQLSTKEKNMKMIPYYTSFKCIDFCEKNKKKLWCGKNAYKYWSKHYKQHHITTQYLQATNQQKCPIEECIAIIPDSQSSCEHHSKNMPVDEIMEPISYLEAQQQTQIEIAQNSEIIMDADGIQLNINRIIQHFDTNNEIKNDKNKEEIATHLIEAINKLNRCNDNYFVGLEGAIQLRLLAPTFNLVPFRGNNAAYNQKKKTNTNKFIQTKKMEQSFM